MPEESKKRVKMIACLAGMNFVHKPGDLVEFDADEADRHLAAGNAVELDEIETAVHDARETAMLKRDRKGKADAK